MLVPPQFSSAKRRNKKTQNNELDSRPQKLRVLFKPVSLDSESRSGLECTLTVHTPHACALSVLRCKQEQKVYFTSANPIWGWRRKKRSSFPHSDSLVPVRRARSPATHERKKIGLDSELSRFRDFVISWFLDFLVVQNSPEKNKKYWILNTDWSTTVSERWQLQAHVSNFWSYLAKFFLLQTDGADGQLEVDEYSMNGHIPINLPTSG